MAWLEAAAAVITAAELASKAAEKADALSTGVARILYWLKNRKTILPVFGAGGVGKSTIGSAILHGARMTADPYEASNLTEKFDLKDKIPARIVVVPGQKDRIDNHWPDQYESIIKGEAIGIINMVSYGYHAFGLHKMAEHKDYVQGDSKESFMERYTANRRDDEIYLLDKLLSALPANRNPIWMITVINKQDLWFPESAEVRAHYESGVYSARIKEFEAQQGSRLFRHDFVPASLTMQNLITKSGEVLKENSAGYDLARHYVSVNFLLETIGKALVAGK